MIQLIKAISLVSWRSREGRGSRRTGNFSPLVLVGSVYIFVFRLILWAHVPIEAVFQPRGVVLIFYPLELLWTTQRTSRLNEMGFGFRNEPVWKYLRDAA